MYFERKSEKIIGYAIKMHGRNSSFAFCFDGFERGTVTF